MSTVNVVKYYFHKANRPAKEARRLALIALAYQTARHQELYPKEVFIRSDVHYHSTIDGKRQKDPRGPHVTLSFKTEKLQGRGTHISCHSYVKDPKTLDFSDAIQTKERRDSMKKRSGTVVWPSKANLWEAPDVWYGHQSK
ncbi:hypothetical protein F53441_1090 [Fusarium austroafricanum]|uniref:Uncharacterized protein n=1 Tax=Fusarium austroafricanum TaxID=2364996 RepID=A0A8H4KWF4_9HYPO|nr:hypothetical protein F53441_1090 [Fusarium austroafricanum]